MQGTRSYEYQEARKRLGITREAVWHQATDDVGAAMMGIAASQEPFDVWFRERMQEIHGIDLAEPAPPPKRVADIKD